MNCIRTISVIAGLFAASAAFASGTGYPAHDSDYPGNIENGKKIFMEGKGDVVPACFTCHGEGGMGDDSMGTPRLAGQGYPYLVKQLEDFAADKREDTTMYIMNANAKGLTAEERRDVAKYINSLDSLALASSDMNMLKTDLEMEVGVRYLGKGLAQQGAPARGIPACHSCHGYNGRGAAPLYPSIGGQRYPYLVNQLMKWRDGSRANDPMGMMQVVARKLTDEDIHNVATFLTSAPRTTMGNARVPGDLPH